MSTYSDIFIRDALGQSNTLPRHGGGRQSPDIIPFGTAPSDDPAKDFGSDFYDQNPGMPVVYGQDNYIYVRGKNYGEATAVGSVFLYAAYQTQLSSPNLWTQLSTQDGENTSAIGGDADGVAVAINPFVWTPAAPSAGNPYLLIAVISTPTNKNPVPAYKKHPSDFAAWQGLQGGVSARGIVAPKPPSSQNTYTFSALVNVGNSAETTANFLLAWEGGVVGDQISLVTDTPGSAGPIGFDSFVITAASQSTIASGVIPANYSSVVHYTYQAKNSAKPPAPTLTLIVSTVGKASGDSGDPLGPPPTPPNPIQVASFQLKAVLGP
jgi:hypothetical protein